MQISRQAFFHNYSFLRSIQKDAAFFPVVKSYAYGHGLPEILSLLEKADCQMIAIDSYSEYQFVTRYTTKNILLLGETFPENYTLFDFARTSFCVYNLGTLKYLASLHRKIRVHIFLNTGMNREGVAGENLGAFLDVLKCMPLLELEGVCSHFASADEVDTSFMEKQIEVFKKMYQDIERAGFSPRYRHIGASSGLLKNTDPFFNAFRPGIALYGYNPLGEADSHFEVAKKLRPVMRIVSHISSIQNIKKGDGVGYNRAYISGTDRTIGVLPFGYFEGLSRRLFGKMFFYHKEKELPLLGKICMNISMFDVSGTNLGVGDEIEIISNNLERKNSVASIASAIGTIPYEVITGFPVHMHREIVDDFLV